MIIINRILGNLDRFYSHYTFCLSQESFLEAQQQIREEKGIDNVDFHETKTTFQLNILARVQALD